MKKPADDREHLQGLFQHPARRMAKRIAARAGGRSAPGADVAQPRVDLRGERLALVDVFVAQGYHAAAMDDIADRAGVSKPVLYQHFPGKLDLYLALLDASSESLVAAVRHALESTPHNKQRVAATVEAYFAFVDDPAGAQHDGALLHILPCEAKVRAAFQARRIARSRAVQARERRVARSWRKGRR